MLEFRTEQLWDFTKGNLNMSKLFLFFFHFLSIDFTDVGYYADGEDAYAMKLYFNKDKKEGEKKEEEKVI